MMIENAIREILNRYPKVVVPEFGGFIARLLRGTSNKQGSEGMLLGKRLYFDQGLKSDDGLLVNYFKGLENKPIEQVETGLHKVVSEWKRKLAEGDRLELKNIGTLYTDKNGNINLEPDSFFFLPQFFGLGDLNNKNPKSLDPVIGDVKKATPLYKAPTTNQPYIRKEATIITRSTSILKGDLFVKRQESDYKTTKSYQKPLDRPAFEKKEDKAVAVAVSGDTVLAQNKVIIEKQNSKRQEKLKNNRNRKFLRYVALLLLLITLATGIYYYWNKDKASKTHEIVQTEVNNKIQRATFFGANPLALETLDLNISISRKPAFHVIAGAYRSRQNAFRRIRQLKKNGFKAQNIGTSPDGLIRVSYKSFIYEEDALEFLGEIRLIDEPEAWLLYQE